ncbi:molybdopterin-binding/glycosyltransferase family 2 protein [uncultured Martelella sp.]|uniref:molybdopterin-binding/glycosyltransferase family 2 protein n=1 Tax=uncultured Martelella sp. TaxID=392331 RepID=UPI0029C830E3|nr:molybdopterin-binding/glycosyltransferase family 2 protein [uncultured Martelella sp.]
MKFETVPVATADGAILAHSLRLSDLTLTKGHALSQSDVDALAERGFEEITVARLEPDDVREDLGVTRAAAGLAGAGVVAAPAHAGRVNLHADAHGLVQLDADAINALNAIDESITIATLSPQDTVRPGDAIATIKIIPFAVTERTLQAWDRAARAIEVTPFVHHRVSLIQTLLGKTKPSVLTKTCNTTAQRLELLGSTLVGEVRVAHETTSVADAITARLAAGDELVLICGASSIVDRKDVIPAAIVAAGGTVEHFGMPVDPGNLLLLGRVGQVQVIGLPGCARAPKLNGMDFVLRRLMAKQPVTAQSIQGMGVGGLLKDLPERPLPRATLARMRDAARRAKDRSPHIGAIILAAGQSSRMGCNKLLLELDKRPLVRHVAEAVAGAKFHQVVAVVGHEGDKVRDALSGLNLDVVENEDYRDGLSTSLRRGIAALGDDIDAVMVCLGDMPDVDVELFRRLSGAFDPDEGRAIVVPVRAGKRGNPVLWGRQFFADLASLGGDVGARHLIGHHAEWVAEVTVKDDGIFTDLDTPEAVVRWKTGQRRAAPD